MGSRDPTIFVSIPSYRDPECQYTIRDLFSKASKPERVFIGVCWQADPEEDAACFLLEPPSHLASNVRVLPLHHRDARGPCYARARIQQELYQDEEYYLQLDSHYRMIPNWDEERIVP
ncbi:[Skp1-protein]-hydroxyproline N-acetylglucosaminyltransferase, partial [Symbiodinium microadriaticum]